MAPKKPKPNPLDFIIFILILATAYTAAITIPISSEYKDVYVKAVIEKPLIGSVKLAEVEVTAQPYTLISTPSMASILASGKVTLKAETDTIKTKKVIGEIYRTSEEEAVLVLKKVPLDENRVTLTVYEGTELADTMEVQIE